MVFAVIFFYISFGYLSGKGLECLEKYFYGEVMAGLRFVHSADLHLGYRQYGLDERFRDYGDVFSEVADFAVDKDVDFFLISGDLFDDRNISASTFSQCHSVLEVLKEKNVPVFVIEGNHDKAYYGDSISWLKALDHQGLLNLIQVKEKEELDVLGDYREFKVNEKTVRLFGVKYVGARTKELFSKINEEINYVNSLEGSADFVILMMHFGLDDQVSRDLGRGYSYNKLVELKDLVDYLALGHYHVPYSVENWVFNPGSLESTKSDEAGYPNGFYFYDDGEIDFIEVDSNRVFEKIDLDLGEFRSRKELLKELRDKKEVFSSRSYSKEPIINVVFRGGLRFEEEDLPVDEIKDLFSDLSLYVNTIKRFEREEIDFDDFDGGQKEEIEKSVLEKLIKQKKPCYRDFSESISEELIEVKNMVIDDVDSDDVISFLRDFYDEVVRGSEGEEDSGSGGTWNWEEAY